MSTPATNLETVILPKPALSPTATLEQALKSRHSSRAFLPDPLSLELLSALLWTGFGINRRDSGGRTAPSAHNWQEIDVFAVLPEGAYRYDAKGHRLLLVKAEDLRGATGVQDFVATAPLNLVYVADFARMPDARAEERDFLAGADAGCIAQNVYLFCAGAGLATVVRGLIDRGQLAAALGLSKTQRITLAQTVGQPAAV
jgi:SagB-type dehydrogenase family enzyme